MKLTKYGHACITLEKDGAKIVIDPGILSDDLVVTDDIVGVIVTHAHADHFDPNKLAAIYDKNPASLLLSTAEVVEKMPNHSSQTITPGEQVSVGPFELTFFGGSHAEIYKGVPVIDNLGILVDNTLYYPGDSFSLPGASVDTLAVPIGAPWLKTSEAIDFMIAIKPRLAFPTHDAVLSLDGQAFNDSWLERFAKPHGITYIRLDKQPVDI